VQHDRANEYRLPDRSAAFSKPSNLACQAHCAVSARTIVTVATPLATYPHSKPVFAHVWQLTEDRDSDAVATGAPGWASVAGPGKGGPVPPAGVGVLRDVTVLAEMSSAIGVDGFYSPHGHVSRDLGQFPNMPFDLLVAAPQRGDDPCKCLADSGYAAGQVRLPRRFQQSADAA